MKANFRNAGRFIATTFNVDDVVVSIIVNEKHNRVECLFDFEPIVYFSGTTRGVIQEVFDACLYRYRLMFGEPSTTGLETFKREKYNAIHTIHILNEFSGEKDIIKLNEAIIDDAYYNCEENLEKN